MERVTVAQLKSRLSYYLREVRAGRSFTVVSRDIPVATLAPLNALSDDGLMSIPADPSAPPLSAPVFGGPADAPDAVELIREGREDRSGPWAAPATVVTIAPEKATTPATTATPPDTASAAAPGDRLHRLVGVPALRARAARPADRARPVHGLVTSVLTEVECLRAVENLRLTRPMGHDEYFARRRAVYDRLGRAERVLVTAEILARAAGPLPAPLRSLDAIHLATALEWRGHREPALAFATHDTRLAAVAAALDFDVIGV